MDELGEQGLGFFVCKFRETAACHTESLAGRGVRADWDLSRERRQLEAQCLRPRAVALSLQGWREGATGVPAKPSRCPGTPGTGGLLHLEGISHLVKVKEGD